MEPVTHSSNPERTSWEEEAVPLRGILRHEVPATAVGGDRTQSPGQQLCLARRVQRGTGKDRAGVTAVGVFSLMRAAALLSRENECPRCERMKAYTRHCGQES